MKTWIVIYILFIIFQMGDGVSTYTLSLITGTHEWEGNPIVLNVMNRFGPGAGLLIVKGVAILCGLILVLVVRYAKYRIEVQLAKISLCILTLIYLGVTLSNLYLIYSIKTA